mmetsp:Transcript_86491/g.243750  ORF Transcript_86491/g.243750 Transcript_86491/m.243750 type:complete len:110 (-) Transcript_86491:33-362(-)
MHFSTCCFSVFLREAKFVIGWGTLTLGALLFIIKALVQPFVVTARWLCRCLYSNLHRFGAHSLRLRAHACNARVTLIYLEPLNTLFVVVRTCLQRSCHRHAFGALVLAS